MEREVPILQGDLANSAEFEGIAMQLQRMNTKFFALITFMPPSTDINIRCDYSAMPSKSL